ncbi:MAG TPA: ABC transporter ATP-binding protein [Candidatus Limnocylindrales bacterium]|nr:ABC transporter ATP-binding protein [Candidatus Limnocylindrales bacterium]
MHPQADPYPAGDPADPAASERAVPAGTEPAGTQPVAQPPAAPPAQPPAAAVPEQRPAASPGASPTVAEGARSATQRATDREPLVVLRGASRDFGDGVGVFGLDVQVPAGTILGIVGPSGSGKTTTIRMITGALDPTDGEVRVLGEDPRRFRRMTRERIGYMPQQFTLYPDLTADENVDFVASLFGMLVRRRRRRVREVLELVQLWEARGRRAGQLSGGMQRRLELACALVHEPALLLLDEPTAGIDPILRQTIWDELARLKAEGRTLLVTTQYVTEAESCDAVALIAGGRLIALGPPEQLRRSAAGGDVIEGETEAPFDPEVLIGKEGIRAARSTGLRRFRVVTDDAGTTTPVLDDLVAAEGGSLTTAREVRLTFDEVFAELVERSARERGEAVSGDAAPATSDAA